MSGRRFKLLLDAGVGAVAVGMLRAIKWTDRRRMANFAGALMRKVGPRLKEHRIGRDNLRAAFPEKSNAEIETILGGVWDNLGRVAVEFAHLDEFGLEDHGPQTPDVILFPPTPRRNTYSLTAAGEKPMIGFAAHTANWELPAVACKRFGARFAVLYRRPNIPAISDLVVKLRAPLMGDLIPTSLDAPVRLARLLQSGVHVGLLADQHYTRGVEVTFFGRKCVANPLVAMLARQTECPIHGLRVVRQPDRNSFSIDVTEPVAPVRDANGQIDIQGTTQAVTNVIESWIREYPEQWLWLHRRWR